MRCPVCRAENDQGPQCRRCRADLGLLFALEEQRQRTMAAAYRELALGKTPHAAAIAEGVSALRHDAESRKLLAVCRLVKGDFSRAWDSYQEARSQEGW